MERERETQRQRDIPPLRKNLGFHCKLHSCCYCCLNGSLISQKCCCCHVAGVLACRHFRLDHCVFFVHLLFDGVPLCMIQSLPTVSASYVHILQPLNSCAFLYIDPSSTQHSLRLLLVLSVHVSCLQHACQPLINSICISFSCSKVRNHSARLPICVVPTPLTMNYIEKKQNVALEISLVIDNKYRM